MTGIAWEPWHFRYVGTPHAQIMEDRGLVLEEYIDFLRSLPGRLLFSAGSRGASSPFSTGPALSPLKIQSAGLGISSTNAGG